MLKTRFAQLAPLVVLAVLFVFSGCSRDPRPLAKAAYPVMKAIIAPTSAVALPPEISETSTTSTVTSPVSQAPVIPPIDLSNWKITQAQAIATASKHVPTNVLSQATISAGMEGSGNLKTGESSYYWAVAFMDISITKAELGWQPNSQTTLDPGAADTYNEIIIRIDAVTGDYISRTAYFAFLLGGPIQTPYDTTPNVPSPITTTITIQ